MAIGRSKASTESAAQHRRRHTAPRRSTPSGRSSRREPDGAPQSRPGRDEWPRRIVDEVASQCGAQRVLIVLSADAAPRHVAAARLPRGEDADALLRAVTPWLDQAQRTRRARLRHGPRGAPRRAQRSCLVAPIVVNSAVAGFLYADADGVRRRLDDADLLRLERLASQASLELDNARLRNEASEALAQQKAMADILTVIASSPSDVQPVFESIVSSCMALFDGQNVALFMARDGMMHRMAFRLAPGAIDEGHSLFPMPLDAQSVNGRVILSGKGENVADILNEPGIGERSLLFAQRMGFSSMLSCPLLRERKAIGSIAIFRRKAEKFTDTQVALLRTFADQAVIAIENARLFGETQEALEQKKASADILGVISSSVENTSPVFGAIAATCERLFEGQFVGINLIDEHGGLRLAASRYPADRVADRDALVQHFEQASTRATGVRLKLRGEIIDFPDIELPDVPDEVRAACRVGHARSIAFAPMVSAGKGIGSIWVARASVGSMPNKDKTLFKTFADQAVIAIQNARLFNETKEALERQTATSAILRVISESPTDVQPVLHAVAERAAALCDSLFASVFLIDGDVLRPHASFSKLDDEMPDLHTVVPLKRSFVTARSLIDRQPVHIDDIVPLLDTEFSDARDNQARCRFRAVLSVPMLRESEAIGAIFTWRREPRPFTPEQVTLLQTFAQQAVIAIENVRLFKQTQQALERQTATAEILKVIARSPAAVQPVFDSIARNAAELCGGMFANVLSFDGTQLDFRASSHADAEFIALARSLYPMRPDVSQISGRTVLAKAPVRMEDALSDSRYDHQIARTG